MADLASPVLNGVLFRAAYRALDQRKPELALGLAARAAAGEDLESLLQLADIQSLAGRATQARETVHRIETRHPANRSDVLVQFALMAAREGDLSAGIALLREYLSRRPAAGAYPRYVLGSLLAVSGCLAEADAIFSRGLLIPCGDGKLTCTRMARFPTAPPSAPPRPFPIPRMVDFSQTDFGVGAEAVYAVCCDAKYFSLFAAPLCNAVTTCGEADLVIHLHIINPTAQSEALLARLAERFGDRLAATRETVNLDHLTLTERRTYYACARFLLLPELLRRYARTILIADADQLVLRSLRPLLTDFTGYDVGLLKFPHQVTNILSLLSATAMLVADNDGGRAFCTTLADILAERFADPAAVGWHLDQAALAVTHLLHARLRTFFLSPSLLHSEILDGGAASRPPSDAVFWSITASHRQNMVKLASPSFLEHLRQGDAAP